VKDPVNRADVCFDMSRNGLEMDFIPYSRFEFASPRFVTQQVRSVSGFWGFVERWNKQDRTTLFTFDSLASALIGDAIAFLAFFAAEDDRHGRTP
jgi:hypothetical protein